MAFVVLQHARERLDSLLDKVPGLLMAVPEEVFRRPLGAGKWSPSQHLGHLLDSARYNLVRFTQLQAGPSPGKYESYPQNHLVEIQGFDRMPRDLMARLWVDYNFHLLWVLAGMNQEMGDRAVVCPDGTLRDLNWLAADYVHHLEHHLGVILGNLSF